MFDLPFEAFLGTPLIAICLVISYKYALNVVYLDLNQTGSQCFDSPETHAQQG